MSEDELKVFKLAVHADRKHTSDAARAVLSTILFHRLLGSLAPSMGDAVGVTYPIATSSEAAAILAEKHKEIGRRFCDGNTQQLQLRVDFYERKVKKTAWFAKTHNVCWERWVIDLQVTDESADARRVTARDLQRALLEVVHAADTNKDHIPAITTTDIAPFPYDVSIY